MDNPYQAPSSASAGETRDLSVFGALGRAWRVFKPVAPAAFFVGLGRGLMRKALQNLANSPWGEAEDFWLVVGVLLDLPYLALLVGSLMVWGLLRLEGREADLAPTLRRVLPKRVAWVLGAKLGIVCFIPWLVFHGLAMAVTAMLALRPDAQWEVEARGLARPLLVLGVPYVIWAGVLISVQTFSSNLVVGLLWGLDGVAVVLFAMTVGAWFLQREALGLTQTSPPALEDSAPGDP